MVPPVPRTRGGQLGQAGGQGAEGAARPTVVHQRRARRQRLVERDPVDHPHVAGHRAGRPFVGADQHDLGVHLGCGGHHGGHRPAVAGAGEGAAGDQDAGTLTGLAQPRRQLPAADIGRVAHRPAALGGNAGWGHGEGGGRCGQLGEAVAAQRRAESGDCGADQVPAVEEGVLLAYGRHVEPRGCHRTGDRERLVKHQIRPPPGGQRDHRVGELVVECAEQQAGTPGAGGAGHFRPRDQRMTGKDPQRDPAEVEARSDVVHRQTGVGGGQGSAAGGHQHVVAGVAKGDRERHQREDVPDERGGDHQHAHGPDPMSTTATPEGPQRRAAVRRMAAGRRCGASCPSTVPQCRGRGRRPPRSRRWCSSPAEPACRRPARRRPGRRRLAAPPAP
ncbi:hypothetical protein ONO86_01600 [Micromonospora noduli]|nr:hypothetical protein ONO86_01600 [Micromonospora noduli]